MARNVLATFTDRTPTRVSIGSELMTAPHNFPGVREEILEEIQASRAEIEAIIDQLSERQLTESIDDGGWSIKDHLAHIASWQKHGIAVISGSPPHEGFGLDKETYEQSDMHGINEILHERNKDRPLNDVLSDFRNTHWKVLTTIERMNDDDLERDLPPEYTGEHRTVREFALNHFSDHDADHVEDIRALANQPID
jgi:hypothetical protein